MASCHISNLLCSALDSLKPSYLDKKEGFNLNKPLEKYNSYEEEELRREKEEVEKGWQGLLWDIWQGEEK